MSRLCSIISELAKFPTINKSDDRYRKHQQTPTAQTISVSLTIPADRKSY
jgi:hypothetical protein